MTKKDLEITRKFCREMKKNDNVVQVVYDKMDDIRHIVVGKITFIGTHLFKLIINYELEIEIAYVSLESIGEYADSH